MILPSEQAILCNIKREYFDPEGFSIILAERSGHSRDTHNETYIVYRVQNSSLLMNLKAVNTYPDQEIRRVYRGVQFTTSCDIMHDVTAWNQRRDGYRVKADATDLPGALDDLLLSR